METKQFDDLARRLGAGSSRRSLLRAVGGTLLAAAATRLGLSKEAEAKGKHHHKAKPKRHRAAHEEHEARGQLGVEGKRGGKKKHKKKHPPPRQEPCAEECNDCQMCQDGACVRDPDLEGVRCLGSGANCGYCQGGFCVPSDVPPCADGACPRQGQCCDDEKRCVDPESPTGFSCVGRDDCCVGEKHCRDGCISQQACCPDQPRPSCGPCDDVFCINGAYQCAHRCCPGQRDCGDDICVDRNECCPNFETTCPDGSCVLAGRCCRSQASCGDGCCATDEGCTTEYVDGVFIPRCCPREKIVGGQCCDGDKTICGPPDNQRCCPAGSQCYQDMSGIWLCCHGTLCGEHRCCTGNQQCFSGCGTPDAHSCCINDTGCGCCRIC
jgi:hypothetical protein